MSSPKNSRNRPSTKTLAAAIGALVYLLPGAKLALSSLASVIDAIRQLTASVGSAGVGSVSVFLDIVLVPYALLAIGAIIVNWMLRGWARASDSTARVLIRVQRWSIVAAFAVLFVEPVAMSLRVGGPWVLATIALTGLSWGVQFLATALLLGVYARRSV